MSKRYVRVACNVHVHNLFDYCLPADAPAEVVGLRVRAPWGNRQVIGIIMETVEQPAVALNKVKPLLHLYQDMPPLPPATLAMINFCASYYHCPIGVAAMTVLPPFFRRSNIYRQLSAYRLTPAGYCADQATLGLRGHAQTLYALLREKALTVAEIKNTVSHPHPALKKLLALNLIESCGVHEESPPDDAAITVPPLSHQQKQALDALRLQPAFTPHLLFGATGSGKSEVYMHAAERVLEQKKQVLILAPEIHLTPQLERYFRSRFPHKHIVVLHSALSGGERTRRWLMARLGEADIVLGTRTAVFIPMPAPGLIIVDEEHDISYKQEAGKFLFSARDLAAWRAKQENIPFIAGSATPSLESMKKARAGSWKLLTMPRRLQETAPRLEIISESEQLYHGMDSAFLQALSGELASGKQCLVFINRRGYAPALLCRECHQPYCCRQCSSNMVVHRRRDILLCHLCGYGIPIPLSCPLCDGQMINVGSGTQRIEEALVNRFPDIRALRIDQDSASARRSILMTHQAEIETGKLQLLIGTQLIAKGHNFPKLSCIGILNTDAALAAPDLRAEERLFALLSQVIGRGTRNPEGCRTLIQTRYPNHPFYRELTQDNVEACWHRLLKEREQTLMPPFAHLCVLRARDIKVERLEKFMQQAAHIARCEAKNNHVQVFDVVSPPIEKINNWHRRQLLIKSRHRRSLHLFLSRLLPALPGSSQWLMDIDPMTV